MSDVKVMKDPIYYLSGEGERTKRQSFLVLVSDNDIPGRREQYDFCKL